MPPIPEPERIRDEARRRIADQRSMVVDGDPIEELAKAHDRHAQRLDAIALELRDVGKHNYLGETSEGRAATNNIRVAAHEDPGSLAGTMRSQAATARHIAEALRQIRWEIANTEDDNRASITTSMP